MDMDLSIMNFLNLELNQPLGPLKQSTERHSMTFSTHAVLVTNCDLSCKHSLPEIEVITLVDLLRRMYIKQLILIPLTTIKVQWL